MFESTVSKAEQIHLPTHLDNAVPAIYHLGSVVADIMAIFAAICLATGNNIFKYSLVVADFVAIFDAISLAIGNYL